MYFENLLPDGAGAGETNSNFNSITLSGRTLAEFGEHGYLFLKQL
jgi:hypothetical protein